MKLPSIEALRAALKEAGQLYFVYAAYNAENVAKQKSSTGDSGTFIATLKMDTLFRAVAVKQELHASAEDLLWDFVMLRSAFLEWEREAVSREVHLWNNIEMSQNTGRCRALLALKVGLEDSARQLRNG